MSTAKLVCPQCQAPLRFLKAPAPGKAIRCPGCQLKFTPAETPPTETEPTSAQRLAILCGLVVVLGVGGIIGWQAVSRSGNGEPAAQSLPEAPPEPPGPIVQSSPTPPPSSAGNEVPPETSKPSPKKFKTYAESKRAATADAPPVLAAISTTAGSAHPLQDRINAAIDKGVAYLQRTQQKNGSWTGGDYQAGYAALGGLTLLEGGVAADHPSVQQAAAFVRSTPIGNHRTYQVALVILFLDRLADPKDVPLIQALGLQLMAGQNERGAWGYEAPTLNPQQSQYLLAMLQKNQLKLPMTLAKGKDDATRKPDAAKETPKRQPVQAKKDMKRPAGFSTLQAPVLQMPPGPNHPLIDIPELNFLVRREDNSNTQFALMALWVARRQGLPAERALLAAAQRLAAQQNSDGGWGYNSGGAQTGTTPSMTCVGLLGLAMGHGLLAPADAKDAAPADPRIAAGLKQLGAVIEPGNLRNLYFLWSLERVAVLYNLRTIGGKDWYDLGARALLEAQQKEGNWQNGGYFSSAASLDTCFAVLFLRRSNLVQDLSERLPLFMAISDPDLRPPPAGNERRP